MHYLDADRLILSLLEKGSSPDPEDGWLEPVQEAVFDALAKHRAVSVEITGSWDSDYQIVGNDERRGHRVVNSPAVAGQLDIETSSECGSTRRPGRPT